MSLYTCSYTHITFPDNWVKLNGSARSVLWLFLAFARKTYLPNTYLLHIIGMRTYVHTYYTFGRSLVFTLFRVSAVLGYDYCVGISNNNGPHKSYTHDAGTTHMGVRDLHFYRLQSRLGVDIMIIILYVTGDYTVPRRNHCVITVICICVLRLFTACSVYL